MVAWFLTSHQGLSASAVLSAFNGYTSSTVLPTFSTWIMVHCLIFCSNVFLTYVSHSSLICILWGCNLLDCTHQCALHTQSISKTCRNLLVLEYLWTWKWPITIIFHKERLIGIIDHDENSYTFIWKESCDITLKPGSPKGYIFF